jgi:hypothetical protein
MTGTIEIIAQAPGARDTAREVCFLIGRGGAILWADTADDPVALPDTRARWEAIWQLRDELEIIAHSHPRGPAEFSPEDESTMTALDGALGRTLRYIVVAPRATLTRVAPGSTEPYPLEPWWTGLLRIASGMPATKED